MSCFMESRSLQWHIRRHELAQQFLDRLVRQNVAEIDEIPFEEHECMVELSLAERSRYLELECHLNALGMNSKSAQKSKRKSTGDRENRMQQVLRESQSGEEALLKCSSSFDASTSVSDIIRLRDKEKNELLNEFKSRLIAAFNQRQRIMDYQPTWTDVKANGKGEVMDALGVYLNEVDAHKVCGFFCCVPCFPLPLSNTLFIWSIFACRVFPMEQTKESISVFTRLSMRPRPHSTSVLSLLLATLFSPTNASKMNPTKLPNRRKRRKERKRRRPLARVTSTP